jgi:hypothetical protein
MIIVSIELATEGTLLGDLVILARIPKALWIWISIDQIADGLWEPFTLAQVSGSEVGETFTNLAS